MCQNKATRVYEGTEFPRRRPQLIKHGAKCMCTLNSPSQPAKVYVKHREGKFMLASITIRMAPGHGNCVVGSILAPDCNTTKCIHALVICSLRIYTKNKNQQSLRRFGSQLLQSQYVGAILQTAQSRSFKSPLRRTCCKRISAKDESGRRIELQIIHILCLRCCVFCILVLRWLSVNDIYALCGCHWSRTGD